LGGKRTAAGLYLYVPAADRQRITEFWQNEGGANG
jgi:hypothetical protein